MEKLVPQLDAQIVDDPKASLFYEPIRNVPATFDEASRAAVAAKYEAAIRDQIVPAYRRLRTFLQEEYLPACRTSYGWSDLPGGREGYRLAVRWSTTTELTPDEIFEIGLAEVKRITAEIDALRAEIDAAGEPEPMRFRSLDSLLVGSRACRRRWTPRCPGSSAASRRRPSRCGPSSRSASARCRRATRPARPMARARACST